MSPNDYYYVDLDKVSVKDSGFSERERAVLELINQKIAAAPTLEAVLNFLFEETQDIMPCDRIGVSFLEEGGRRVVAHWARATYEPVLLVQGYSADMEGSTLRQVMDAGVPRVINDLEAYLKSHPDSPSTKLLLREGVRSSLTCPLMVDGRAIGFAFRSSKKPNVYTDHEVALHRAIHERLSQAVEKAWRIRQLEEANRAYMEMLGFVAHELKNPVASIITQGRMLQDGLWGELPPGPKDIVSRMITKAEYLLNLTKEYLDLARFEGGQAKPSIIKDVDFFKDIAEPSLDVIQPQIAENESQLEWPQIDTPILVDIDPNLIKVVVINLLGNAAKYGSKGGRIRVSAVTGQERLKFSVWNEGPGFPESMKGYLFRRFSRLPKKELISRKGSGVGLYVTWQIVQMHGGRIWANSQEGQWAEFSFEIPLRQSPSE